MLRLALRGALVLQAVRAVRFDEDESVASTAAVALDAASAAARGTICSPKQGTASTCADVGCIGFVPCSSCQCNSQCKQYGNCCLDYDEVCLGKGDDFATPTIDSETPELVRDFWTNTMVIYGLLLCVGTCAIDRCKGFDPVTRALAMTFEEHLENKFTDENEAAYRKSGSRLMMILAAFLGITQAVQLAVATQVACFQPLNYHAQVLALILLLAVACISCWIWVAGEKDKGRREYTLAIEMLQFVVPALGLPPFRWTCTTLSLHCSQDPNWFVRQVINRVDCSLQGCASIQLVMIFVFMQAFLYARIESHLIGVLRQVAVYSWWSMSYRSAANMRVYDHEAILVGLVVVCLSVGLSVEVKYSRNKAERASFMQQRQQWDTSTKMYSVLEGMLPQHVLVPMLDPTNTSPIAEHVEMVSILFVLIDDFRKFTNTKTPKDLLAFLNKEFTQMDEIFKEYKVTKIETVGEEYVACTGVSPADVEEYHEKGHEKALERLFTAAGKVLECQTDEVRYKMGCHSGQIVAGVIGTKLPRYRLFGDTINTAARQMQKGLPGQLQFGRETLDQLPADVREHVSQVKAADHAGGLVKERGMVAMKGKGEVMTYTFEPSKLGQHVSSQGFEVPMKPQNPPLKKINAIRFMIKMQGLQAVSSSRRSSSSSGGGPNEIDARFSVALAKDKGLRSGKSLLPQVSDTWRGFEAETETSWLAHFHEKRTRTGFGRKMGSQIAIILVFTWLDLYWFVRSSTQNYDHPWYTKTRRWLIFTGSRSLLIFISVFWLELSEFCPSIHMRPKTLQWAMALTTCAYVFILFLSYDALLYTNGPQYRKHTNFPEVFRGPADSISFLSYLLIVTQVSRMFLFYQATVLMAVAVSCICFLPRLATMSLHLDLHSEETILDWESPFSLVGEVYFFVFAFLVCGTAFLEEETSRENYRVQQRVEKLAERTTEVLDTLMPPGVVCELRELDMSAQPPSHKYRYATIAQSDLCGFTQLSSTRTPEEIVKFMGDLFGAFDKLTDEYGVYKVETIGDAYIVGSAEAPLTKENSPAGVVRFSLAMVKAVDAWSRDLKVNVRCRVGVAYGDCMGGIVGIDMQRYHLFGDLLTVMDTLEATSVEGRVQISLACLGEVLRQLRDEPKGSDNELIFEERAAGELMTSKGEVHTFDEVGGQTYLVKERENPRSVRDSQASNGKAKGRFSMFAGGTAPS